MLRCSAFGVAVPDVDIVVSCPTEALPLPRLLLHADSYRLDVVMFKTVDSQLDRVTDHTVGRPQLGASDSMSRNQSPSQRFQAQASKARRLARIPPVLTEIGGSSATCARLRCVFESFQATSAEVGSLSSLANFARTSSKSDQFWPKLRNVETGPMLFEGEHDHMEAPGVYL